MFTKERKKKLKNSFLGFCLASTTFASPILPPRQVPTEAPTVDPTPTLPIETPTLEPTFIFTPSETPTEDPMSTATFTSTPSPSETPTFAPTFTPTPIETPTFAPTPTSIPTLEQASPTPTEVPKSSSIEVRTWVDNDRNGQNDWTNLEDWNSNLNKTIDRPVDGVLIEALKLGPDGKFVPSSSVVSYYYEPKSLINDLTVGTYALHVIAPGMGQSHFSGYVSPNLNNPGGSDVREDGGPDSPGIIGPFVLDANTKLEFDAGLNPLSPDLFTNIESNNANPVQTGDVLSGTVTVENVGYGSSGKGKLMVIAEGGLDVIRIPDGCVNKTSSSIICGLPNLFGEYTPDEFISSPDSWLGNFEFRVRDEKVNPKVFAVASALYNSGAFSFVGNSVVAEEWQRIAEIAEIDPSVQVFLPLVINGKRGIDFTEPPLTENGDNNVCIETAIPMSFQFKVRSAEIAENNLFNEVTVTKSNDISPLNTSSIKDRDSKITWGYAPSTENKITPNSEVSFIGNGPYLSNDYVSRLSCFDFNAVSRTVVLPNADGSWTFGVREIGDPTVCVFEWESKPNMNLCEGEIVVGAVAQ